MNPERKQRDNSRWGVMRRMSLVAADGTTYLDRIRILQTPWFGIYLHRIDAPDPGLDLHDHPWPFISLVLRGGYVEERADIRAASQIARCVGPRGKSMVWKQGSIHRMPLTQAHRIIGLKKCPTWTLLFVGRRSQSWGFYTPEEFVDHDDYDYVVRRALSETRS